MTVIEALKRSKENGIAYSRAAGSCWVRWLKDWTYELDVEDLLADDWEANGDSLCPKCRSYGDAIGPSGCDSFKCRLCGLIYEV